MSILSRVKTWVDQEVLEASDLNAEFDAIVNNIIAGTTASVGVVQLEDSHTSTSTTKAACPKNVKEAYDLAGTMLTKATFDANTFIYAVSDNAPIKKTRAQVMALLSGQATGSFDMNAQRVVSVDDPTGDQDAATKKYVDDNSDLLSPSGTVLLGGTGGANNENLTFNFETESNKCCIDSTTGVSAIKWAIDSQFTDNQGMRFGNSVDSKIVWNNGTIDGLEWGVQAGSNDQSGYISVMESSHMGDSSREPSAFSADPVFRIYSADTTQANDYIEFYHNQANAIIDWGNGALVLSGSSVNVTSLTASQAIATNADKDLISRTYAALMGDLSGQATADFDMNTQKIIGIVDPTANQDAATKKYVDDTALLDVTFNANTFIYAVSDNTPVVKTRAEVMALLSGQAGADFSMGTHKITAVTDPTANQEAATKKYVDDNVDSHFIVPGAGTLSAAAAAASDGDVLWLKEGVYTETVPIAITSKSLSIIGAGPKVSTIRCTGTHGVVVDTNATTKHVTLKDFTIETTSTGTHIAIQLEGENVASNVHKQFHVNNIEIRPYDVLNDYWHTGIKLIEGWNTVISGCHIEGKSMTLSMDYGVHLTSQSIDVSITDCHFNFLHDGIKVTGSTEGLMISNSVFVYVGRGVYASGGILWLGLFNSHINAFLGAINCSPLNQSKIVGNLFYKREDSSNDFVGIQLSTSGSHNTISSNTIRGVGISGSEYGIVVGAGLTRNIISGNCIDQQITGIWLQSGANNNIANANITSNCTNEVVDEGTGNSVTDNLAV